MKKFTSFLLVFVAPPCVFFSSYLGGRDFISRGTGFLVSGIAMFLLPFLVSALIATVSAKSLVQRILAFMATLVVQFVLIFAFVPPGARSEMIGVGHRLRNMFQAAEIQICAKSILQKRQAGLLDTNLVPPNLYPPLTHATVFVAESELPTNLQGKFRCIGIEDSKSGPRVFFEVEPQIGIIYGKNSDGKGFFHYELAEDIYAYRYQRL
jgi:hypothetical protein